MKIIAQCPRCRTSRLLKSSAADKRIRCRKCLKLFRVPALENVPKAVKIIKQAKGIVYVDQNGNVYG